MTTDLALGATLTELRTGDVGRFHADDGVFEIVGRRSRFVKPFGVRVDLDLVEQELGRSYGEVAVSGDDERVVVVAPGASAAIVSRRVSELFGSAGITHRGRHHRAGAPHREREGRLRAPSSRRDALDRQPDAMERSEGSVAGNLRRRRSDDPTSGQPSTFISLGGDSLSYIECSLRLEHLLGRFP